MILSKIIIRLGCVGLVLAGIRSQTVFAEDVQRDLIVSVGKAATSLPDIDRFPVASPLVAQRYQPPTVAVRPDAIVGRTVPVADIGEQNDNNEPPRSAATDSLAAEPNDGDDAVISGDEFEAAQAEESPSIESMPNQTAGLSPEMLALRDKVEECLVYYFDRPENAASRSPWGIMHALIAYGVDTEIYAGNRKLNAIGWLCWNGSCRGQSLFYVANGKLQTRVGPGVQGHEGQFLAMLAQSRVSRDYPIKIDGYDFTVNDLIEHEKITCQPRTELTFKLIGLAHYLDCDATWKNQQGEEWSIPRLIQEELAQPIVGAACGGTHRMMGFSYAVHKREKSGQEMTGQWLRAKKFVDSFHEYTFKLQNSDGSFSTDWFKGRAEAYDVDRRIQTTGHILEWLVYSLPEDQLRDPRVVKSVDYLTNVLLDNRSKRWEIGPQGHALHALAIYDQRVFGAKVGQGGPKIASRERGAVNEK